MSRKKREELGLKYKKKKYWLRGRSALSIYNKLMLCKQILKPVWTYGIQLWGCTEQSNTESFNDFKTKYLGTSSMHLGISERPTSIVTFKWRWLGMELESSLRSMKKGFSATSTSKRSIRSTTVNWCEGLKKSFELV